MKHLLAAVAIVLVSCSVASAAWVRVARAPVVYGYWPAAPVYSYSAPVVGMPAYVAPIPVVAPTTVLYPAPVWRARPYYYGPAYPYVVRGVVW